MADIKNDGFAVVKCTECYAKPFRVSADEIEMSLPEHEDFEVGVLWLPMHLSEDTKRLIVSRNDVILKRIERERSDS